MSNESYWFEICNKAEALATEAHRGQFRRPDKTPYINHCKDLISCLVKLARQGKWSMEDFYRRCAIAWLHDTREDTELTVDDMRNAGIPEVVIKNVERLTKLPGESYETFICRGPHSNIDARLVKIADILANLADDPTEKQMRKYGHALVMLNPIPHNP